MLRGRFGDTSGCPYIEGRIYLPRLKIEGNLSLLIDTGADSSVLMPADVIRLGVAYNQLSGDSEIFGIGGAVHCYKERAILVFAEFKVAAYAYDLIIDIMPYDDTTLATPSLLGRDILNRWRIVYDPLIRSLRAQVKEADMRFDLSAE